ncbi:AC18-like protein [Orgyia pseudotsugata single capsid nuclopolyhedrovirus]|nr:AC18-like protein [Orgyia pseudotsugata single capsid nuclopolyhedrovirus]
MDLIKNQLYYTKTLPYITKKHINDALCQRVLSQLDRSFYAKVYETAKNNIRVTNDGDVDHEPLIVLKSDVAAETHLGNTTTPLHKLNLAVYVNESSRGADTDDLAQAIFDTPPFAKLSNCLSALSSEYRCALAQIVNAVELAELIDSDDYLKNFNGFLPSASSKIIVLKPYEDQAYEFPPSSDVTFTLNPNSDVKLTTSIVSNGSNQYLLVRYSFNVHATSDLPIWLHSVDDNGNAKSVKRYNYVPLDLYFLDMQIVVGAHRGVVESRDPFALENYLFTVAIDGLEDVIVDQLEYLLFDVFNFAYGKIKQRMSRLRALIDVSFDTAAASVPTKIEVERRRFYRIAKDTMSKKYTIQNVGELLRGAGHRLGAHLVIELYFMKRFRNDIGLVTHQIHFPYHIWYPRYFSVCWKQYCRCINNLFNFSLYIN